MKNVKINFVGFWETFNKTDNFLVNALRTRFDVEITDDPDYVFVSCFTNMFDFVNYRDAVRIFVSGEDLTPDFTFFDYSIGYGEVDYGDRFLFYPCFLYHETWKQFDIPTPSREEAYALLREKTLFCNFIYGEDDKNHIRSNFFNALSTYKHVDSFGTFLNNQPGGKAVSYLNLIEKIQAQQKCKFSIVVECENFENYVTEKIHHAILAGTIPIYFGTRQVATIFNKRRFIDASDFDSIPALVDYIKDIDENDDLFVSTISEKAFVDDEYVEKQNGYLEAFLHNIFSQTKNKAFRRAVLSKSLERIEKKLYIENQIAKTLPYKLIRRLFKKRYMW